MATKSIVVPPYIIAKVRNWLKSDMFRVINMISSKQNMLFYTIRIYL